MKAIGVVRKTDNLGRIVLPKELRESLNIREKDALEIYVSEKEIILKKYEPYCVFCEEVRSVINFKDKNICIDCIEKIKNKK